MVRDRYRYQPERPQVAEPPTVRVSDVLDKTLRWVLGQSRWTEQPAGDRTATPSCVASRRAFARRPECTDPCGDPHSSGLIAFAGTSRWDVPFRWTDAAGGRPRRSAQSCPTPANASTLPVPCHSIDCAGAEFREPSPAQIDCSVITIRFYTSACRFLGCLGNTAPTGDTPDRTGDTSPTRLMLDASNAPMVQRWYRYHSVSVPIATKKCLRRPVLQGRRYRPRSPSSGKPTESRCQQ
jgi:hypothetical protein